MHVDHTAFPYVATNSTGTGEEERLLLSAGGRLWARWPTATGGLKIRAAPGLPYCEFPVTMLHGEAVVDRWTAGNRHEAVRRARTMATE